MKTIPPCRPTGASSANNLRGRSRLIGFTLGCLGLVWWGIAPLQGQPVIQDNFDSYGTVSDMVAAGWRLSALNPALVTTTFPASGQGKALRLQANPVPNTAPAVGMWYRTNEYTEFFVAVDLVDWPGTDKNQAMVVFGHLTDANTGTIPPNLNPATAQGVICNYDASQYGENPTDRRQGQFQINVVYAGRGRGHVRAGPIVSDHFQRSGGSICGQGL